MKIAVVTTSYPRHAGDGAGHFVKTEVDALRAAGHELLVLCPEPGDDAFGFPGALARIRARPVRALGALRFALRAARHLRRAAQLDRVIAHWLVPSAVPIALLQRAPLEVVVHGSDVALLERLPRPVARLVVWLLVRRGANFRCVSHDLRNRLIRLSGAALAALARVEPCAVDLSAAPTREQARARLGIGVQVGLAVVVGRLVPGKRVQRAISAASLLPVEVVVVGDGPELAAAKLRFPGVRFAGQLPRPECLAWIAAADLLISASRHEGAPTVLREARALGVPVVACAAGDLELWAETDPGVCVVA
jgi:teichuronic acid biosynthesis glycosyltransferase TuaC